MMEMESLLVAKCVCWLLRIWGSNRPAERVATIGGVGLLLSEAVRTLMSKRQSSLPARQ